MRPLAPPEGAEFITVAQAAHVLQCCTRTVREYVKAGRLRRYGERGLYRLRRAEVLSALTPVTPEDEDAAVTQAIMRRAGG